VTWHHESQEDLLAEVPYWTSSDFSPLDPLFLPSGDMEEVQYTPEPESIQPAPVRVIGLGDIEPRNSDEPALFAVEWKERYIYASYFSEH
jgi:hypothetical protein